MLDEWPGNSASPYPQGGAGFQTCPSINAFSLAPVDECARPAAGGIKIDLLLSWPDGSLWAIEIKRSLSPKLGRGFHAACADLAPTRKFVVYPGGERYRHTPDIEAISLAELAAELIAA